MRVSPEFCYSLAIKHSLWHEKEAFLASVKDLSLIYVHVTFNNMQFLVLSENEKSIAQYGHSADTIVYCTVYHVFVFFRFPIAK